jgi:hypothetical protein
MSSPSQDLRATPDEPGMILGLSLIALLVALLAGTIALGGAGHTQRGIGSVLGGLYLVTWGVMFLLSYFYSYKTFLFRALMWVCTRGSSPRGRRMAFFYFGLATLIGSMVMLSGLGVV